MTQIGVTPESLAEAIHTKNVRIKLLEGVIQDIHDICLCERFETEGFDYHEKHPRRKESNGGKRPMTPRDLIENRLGFVWKYENESKGARSWKELKLWFRRKELGE